jgi:hypothetical protein
MDVLVAAIVDAKVAIVDEVEMAVKVDAEVAQGNQATMTANGLVAEHRNIRAIAKCKLVGSLFNDIFYVTAGPW